MTDFTNDPVLVRLRAALTAEFGDRLERALLFGPRVRGATGDDIEYDVAVFLRDMQDRWRDMCRLAEIETDIFYDTGASLEIMPYSAGYWRTPTPLMQEIRRAGVEL
jgi:hypothetical protein